MREDTQFSDGVNPPITIRIYGFTDHGGVGVESVDAKSRTEAMVEAVYTHIQNTFKGSHPQVTVVRLSCGNALLAVDPQPAVPAVTENVEDLCKQSCAACCSGLPVSGQPTSPSATVQGLCKIDYGDNDDGKCPQDRCSRTKTGQSVDWYGPQYYFCHESKCKSMFCEGHSIDKEMFLEGDRSCESDPGFAEGDGRNANPEQILWEIRHEKDECAQLLNLRHAWCEYIKHVEGGSGSAPGFPSAQTADAQREGTILLEKNIENRWITFRVAYLVASDNWSKLKEMVDAQTDAETDSLEGCKDVTSSHGGDLLRSLRVGEEKYVWEETDYNKLVEPLENRKLDPYYPWLYLPGASREKVDDIDGFRKFKEDDKVLLGILELQLSTRDSSCATSLGRMYEGRNKTLGRKKMRRVEARRECRDGRFCESSCGADYFDADKSEREQDKGEREQCFSKMKSAAVQGCVDLMFKESALSHFQECAPAKESPDSSFSCALKLHDEELLKSFTACFQNQCCKDPGYLADSLSAKKADGTWGADIAWNDAAKKSGGYKASIIAEYEEDELKKRFKEKEDPDDNRWITRYGAMTTKCIKKASNATEKSRLLCSGMKQDVWDEQVTVKRREEIICNSDLNHMEFFKCDSNPNPIKNKEVVCSEMYKIRERWCAYDASNKHVLGRRLRLDLWHQFRVAITAAKTEYQYANQKWSWRIPGSTAQGRIIVNVARGSTPNDLLLPANKLLLRYELLARAEADSANGKPGLGLPWPDHDLAEEETKRLQGWNFGDCSDLQQLNGDVTRCEDIEWDVESKCDGRVDKAACKVDLGSNCATDYNCRADDDPAELPNLVEELEGLKTHIDALHHKLQIHDKEDVYYRPFLNTYKPLYTSQKCGINLPTDLVYGAAEELGQPCWAACHCTHLSNCEQGDLECRNPTCTRKALTCEEMKDEENKPGCCKLARKRHKNKTSEAGDEAKWKTCIAQFSELEIGWKVVCRDGAVDRHGYRVYFDNDESEWKCKERFEGVRNEGLLTEANCKKKAQIGNGMKGMSGSNICEFLTAKETMLQTPYFQDQQDSFFDEWNVQHNSRAGTQAVQPDAENEAAVITAVITAIPRNLISMMIKADGPLERLQPFVDLLEGKLEGEDVGSCSDLRDLHEKRKELKEQYGGFVMVLPKDRVIKLRENGT